MHWNGGQGKGRYAMHFTAFSDGTFDLNGQRVRCALGPGGVIAAAEKREGDGATPLGVWPMRRVLYRPDRGEAPRTALPVAPITPTDGWCDDPADANYNRPVLLPYPASREEMWREDELYDVVVILGHNDDPPVAGLGSAIFLHCAKPGYPPTQGCVALAKADLLAVLAQAQPGDALEIRRA
jgi:L,D-peptidoglycan transpeptidase YkuD (ErfK/YbiS/YcfS/YnhG family)